MNLVEIVLPITASQLICNHIKNVRCWKLLKLTVISLYYIVCASVGTEKHVTYRKCDLFLKMMPHSLVYPSDYQIVSHLHMQSFQFKRRNY